MLISSLKKTKRNLFVNCGVYSKIIKYANTLIKKKIISGWLQTSSAVDVSWKQEFYAFVLPKITSNWIASFLGPIIFLCKRSMKAYYNNKNTDNFERFIMLINHQNI